jgi:hypothetical protein
MELVGVVICSVGGAGSKAGKITLSIGNTGKLNDVAFDAPMEQSME